MSTQVMTPKEEKIQNLRHINRQLEAAGIKHRTHCSIYTNADIQEAGWDGMLSQFAEIGNVALESLGFWKVFDEGAQNNTESGGKIQNLEKLREINKSGEKDQYGEVFAVEKVELLSTGNAFKPKRDW